MHISESTEVQNHLTFKPVVIIPSSCEKYVKYFSNKFTLQFCTFALNTGNISVEPAGITSIVVRPKSSEYPAPGSTILTSVTDPFSKTRN